MCDGHGITHSRIRGAIAANLRLFERKSDAGLSLHVIKQGQERAPLYHGSSFIPASNYRGGGHPAVLSSSVIEERNNEASKQCRAVSTN